MKLPQNVAFLERYIRRMFASEREAYRMCVSMANVVLAQMLPGGVVRGGTLMNFRYGPDCSDVPRADRAIKPVFLNKDMFDRQQHKHKEVCQT